MAKFYQHLRSTRIKTGIWTLIILLILLFGYLWLTNRLELKSQQNLKVLFTNVMGLETGDKIMYRGMEAGRIKSVVLHPQGILVSGNISTQIILYEGSRFYIEDSLMGSKSLNIEPGSKKEQLDLSQIQLGEDPSGMMAMIAKAGKTLTQVDEILLSIRRNGGIIDQGESLIRRADGTLRSAQSGIDSLKDEFSVLIGEVDELTGRINLFVDESQDHLLQTIKVAPATMGRVNSTLDSLSVLSAKLNRSVDAISDGKGSAGKILTDDELYNNILQSVDKLDQLIEDIKANPKKYLKISIF